MSGTEEEYVRYNFVGKVGRGSFGVVYLIDNNTGPKLAFKAVHLLDLNEKSRQQVAEEAKLLHSLDHKHLVHFLTAYVDKSYLCIVTEYCQGGDVVEFLTCLGFFPHSKTSKRVPEKLVTCWLMQTCSALNYMHTHEPLVLHRDIKPQNIFITEKGDVRLGDFGAAKKLQDPQNMAHTIIGTLFYMCPEIFKHCPYNSKADIYSLGCVFYNIIAGQTSGSFLFLQRIKNQKLKMPEGYSKELLKIIERMLAKKFDKRPSAGKILDSKIIKGFLRQPQEPMTIILEHTHSSSQTLKLTKKISEIEGDLPFTDFVMVPQVSLKILQRAVGDYDEVDGYMVEIDGCEESSAPEQATGDPSSFGDTESDDDVWTAEETGGETFFDSEQTPELDEKALILKREQLQSECASGLGQEKLDQVLEVIHKTQDMNSLSRQLEEVIGELYADYGAKVLELCLLKCSLDN